MGKRKEGEETQERKHQKENTGKKTMEIKQLESIEIDVNYARNVGIKKPITP